MYTRTAITLGLLVASATLAGAQPKSFTSAEGRSMSFELIVTNRSPAVVTIIESQAYSGQATGRRQYKPILIRRAVPAGSMETRLELNGVIAETATAATIMPMEQISFNFVNITWDNGGAQQSCSAKFPASYRASDRKVVVQMGDLASLMTPDGRPVPAKCQER